jgi:flavin reductase (DIM6/NTAB) family NADH-FMN oxidoreductase RutF
MATFNRSSIEALERFFRTNLINSATGFKSVALIGTASAAGEENLAIFSQIIHVGANPPLIGVLFRPDKVARHTLENIRSTQVFTINHIRPNFVKQAHHTAARWEGSEFDACHLTPEYDDAFAAPFVGEAQVKIGLQYTEEHQLANETILLVGEIQQLSVPDSCLGDDGFIDLERAQSVTCSGLDSYHVTQKLVRLSYAKPHQPLKEI